MRGDDREEFETILAEIFGALDKPLSETTREGILKGLRGKMALLEFSRVRDLVLSELENGERPNRFGLPEIWAAKKRLRAKVPQTLEHEQDAWEGDGWDILSNQHLFAYILRQIHARRKFDERATQILVTAKKLWARDMREAAAENALPLDAGKAWFEDAMRRAEEVIAQKVAA